MLRDTIRAFVFAAIIIVAMAYVKSNSRPMVPIRIVDAQTGSVSKTPFEVIDVGLNFASRLCPDGTNSCAPMGISLDSVVATNVANRQDATATIVTPSPVPAVVPGTDIVIVRVQNGSVAENYDISIRIVKNDTGEKMAGDITLHIVGAQ